MFLAFLILDGQLNPLPKLAHNVATFEAPNSYRRKIKESFDKNCSCQPSNVNSNSCRCCDNRPSDLDYFLSCFDDALNSLAAKGLRPAAVIVDPIFSSNGLLDPPKGYLQVRTAFELFFNSRKYVVEPANVVVSTSRMRCKQVWAELGLHCGDFRTMDWSRILLL